jgi:hypothetical protein
VLSFILLLFFGFTLAFAFQLRDYPFTHLANRPLYSSAASPYSVLKVLVFNYGDYGSPRRGNFGNLWPGGLHLRNPREPRKANASLVSH